MSRRTQTLSPRAIRTMRSAVWNARESRCAGAIGRPAAWRKTIVARATPVRCGTIRRFALALRPPTVITRWCRARQPRQFRSGGHCNDDQLTLMSKIWPNRTSKTEINSGSSREISPVRGHHAPSISLPSSDASVSRTGLARRRVSAALIVRGIGVAAEVLIASRRCSNESTIDFCHRILLERNGIVQRICAIHGTTLRSSRPPPTTKRLVAEVTPPFARVRRQMAAGAQFAGPRNAAYTL